MYMPLTQYSQKFMVTRDHWPNIGHPQQMYTSMCVLVRGNAPVHTNPRQWVVCFPTTQWNLNTEIISC